MILDHRRPDSDLGQGGVVLRRGDEHPFELIEVAAVEGCLRGALTQVQVQRLCRQLDQGQTAAAVLVGLLEDALAQRLRGVCGGVQMVRDLQELGSVGATAVRQQPGNAEMVVALLSVPDAAVDEGSDPRVRELILDEVGVVAHRQGDQESKTHRRP